MVVVMKPGTRQQDIDALVSRLKELDLDVGITNGVGCTILGLVGDTTAVDMDPIFHQPPCGAGHAGAGALQEGQPQVPPGGHGGLRGERQDRRGKFLRDRRPLLGGERGADRAPWPRT